MDGFYIFFNNFGECFIIPLHRPYRKTHAI